MWFYTCLIKVIFVLNPGKNYFIFFYVSCFIKKVEGGLFTVASRRIIHCLVVSFPIEIIEVLFFDLFTRNIKPGGGLVLMGDRAADL